MSALDTLRGGLVVSCQPVDDGPMDRPEIVAAMAAAAVAGGANGLRIEGVDNLVAVRQVVSVPIIGILKRDLDDSPVRITPYLADVKALAEAGADIIAYDATDRPRPETTAAIVAAIHAARALAMADCSTLADGQRALAEGAAILGTTLSGYTAETKDRVEGVDHDLIHAFHQLGGFVMAEGRVNTPELAGSAMAAGADAVTVGTALTRLEHVTGWFQSAVAQAVEARS
ncbi:putative N-acetylmannosamine-6-phosphate 2-epimerase [Aliiroseovarius sp. S1339]|uniref:N-acetylmannosamine-6-phosphate 2-epimerase n=1 Tax=Aliiroseovarius sp. S1339 TaxID=2936990 RepID=UPI0020BDB6C9|nr:putative N-acetylmannosamine-6-phosphate 2-epimerase [Aliiroseovarius sp. S1339]MCK8462885.1 putative N-acetylmannosamine-6-phosphate 2-epimerase [Aliiroseovarius sp. S1339]